MAIGNNNNTVEAKFFEPVDEILPKLQQYRKTPRYDDESFVKMGILRVLENSKSGRAFLQEHALRFEKDPGLMNYFRAFKSERRSRVIQEVGKHVEEKAKSTLPNRLSGIPELENYECFAADGHWHQGAVHDAKNGDRKEAAGHVYSVDLKTHTVRHLESSEGFHDHDMKMLKRAGLKTLRHGIKKGKRVILIYDRGGIDYKFWARCRRSSAIYFISRPKSNMVYDVIDDREFDKQDSINNGIRSDRQISQKDEAKMRLIEYTAPRTGEVFQFITNEMSLSPGVIAELYHRRWEVEKVFDELKNKLEEKKAWASSIEAKTVQARLCAITLNLLALYEMRIDAEHGVKNHLEEKRKLQRIREEINIALDNQRSMSSLLKKPKASTQRSVKFIRWLRSCLRFSLEETRAIAQLRAFYAVF